MHSNSESTLISLGKWGFLSVKIPGYFPHSFTTNYQKVSKFSREELKSQKLTFSFSSVPSIYSIFILILLTAWDLFFFSRQSSFGKYLRARGPTEKYAYYLMFGISSILGIYIGLSSLKNGKKFLKFWAGNIALFEEVRLHLNLEIEEDNNFRKIEKSLKKSYLFLIIPVALHILISYGYRVVDSILNEDVDGTQEDIELAVGLAFWTFFALSGSGVSVWMTFFIQFYTSCLHSVLEKLKGKQDQKLPFIAQELFKKRKEVVRNDVESELEKIISTFQSILGGIDKFNEFFGVILIFEMSVCVLNLLVYLFFALVWLGRGELGLLMDAAVPIYIYGKELYDVGSYSEEMRSAAASVVRAFGEDVPLDVLSLQMHLKLQMLATQVSANPPAVSAKQFFLIDRSLVTSVLSGLATFLVVLVQFRDADSA